MLGIQDLNFKSLGLGFESYGLWFVGENRLDGSIRIGIRYIVALGHGVVFLLRGGAVQHDPRRSAHKMNKTRNTKRKRLKGRTFCCLDVNHNKGEGVNWGIRGYNLRYYIGL